MPAAFKRPPPSWSPPCHARPVESAMNRFVLVVAVVLTSWLLPSDASAANLTCPTATTLDALATCVRNQMPGSGSNKFVAPSAAEQADWRSVVRQMLQGSCNQPLPPSLAGVAQWRTFTDAGNGRTYCLLIEVLDANNDARVDR